MDKDHRGGEVFPTIKNSSNKTTRKLNYIIHNPNSEEETVKELLGVLVQVNAGKVEGKIRELSETVNQKDEKLKLTKVAENS